MHLESPDRRVQIGGFLAFLKLAAVSDNSSLGNDGYGGL
jgi:hypothetical protein